MLTFIVLPYGCVATGLNTGTVIGAAVDFGESGSYKYYIDIDTGY